MEHETTDAMPSTHKAPSKRRLERETAKRRRLAQRPSEKTLFRRAMHWALCLSGMRRRGERNANRPVMRHLVFAFADLPPAFDGFRILHISDPHFSGHPGYLDAFCALVDGHDTDLCVMTGDFPWCFTADYAPVYDGLDAILSRIMSRHGVIAVLGNNDTAALIEPLEARGVRVLMNEAVEIHEGDEFFFVAGVDDPSDFGCHDLASAFEDVPRDAFTALLVHSPDIAREAAAQGVALYLCGHTHAGQIRLPLLGPLYTNSRAPREFCGGVWRVGSMQGYTTSGIGTTAVPVRFNCPPEVASIELRRSS